MNQEVRLLFHELADLSPDEREQVFRHRQIERRFRAELESLLSFDATTVGGFPIACQMRGTGTEFPRERWNSIPADPIG